MLTVKIHKLDGDGNDVHHGTIRWDGKKMSIEPPDDGIMKNIIGEEAHNGRKFITAKENPEQFLRCLAHKYRTAYLRASDAEEDK